MKSENINELAAALAKAQGAMKAAAYNKINPHFRNKYADMAAVIDAIREPLSANGLSYTQTMQPNGSGFYLLTTLLHCSGQWISGMYPLPDVGKPQEFGSALTYGRRYSLSAIMGIAPDDVDDDAEGANGQKVAAPKEAPAVEPKRQNPHVNRLEDMTDRRPRYDTDNNRIDWIDTSMHRVPHLTGERAKVLWNDLKKSMRMSKTPEELVEWGVTHAERVASLGKNEEFFQLMQYQDFLDELRAKEPPPADDDLGLPDFLDRRNELVK